MKRFAVYKNILWLIIGVKVLLLLLVIGGKNLLPFSQFDYQHNGYHFTAQQGNNLEQSLSSYDGQLYLELAHSGYTQVPVPDPGERIYAFFPLYPLLTYLLSWLLGGNLFLAGILLSLLASIIGAVFLYELFQLDTTKETARKGVWYFLIFPAGIFFLSLYSESLFFCLSVMAFYFARKRAWWPSALCGYLAALTRSPGVLLFVPLVIEYGLYLKEQHVTWQNLWQKTKGSFLLPLLVPLGLATFMTYSYLTTGNFFLPLDIQRQWGRQDPNILNIFNVLWLNLKNFFRLPLYGFKLSQMDTGLTVVFLGMVFAMVKKMRISYSIYALLLILLPLSSGSTMSMTRFLALSFPHYLLLAQWGTKSKTVDIILSLSSIVLLCIFTLRFINWYWIG